MEDLLDTLGNVPDVEVRVRFADDALDLVVSGPLSRAGTAPFEGARERVAMHAGTLRTTVLRGRAEAVVSLPSLVAA